METPPQADTPHRFISIVVPTFNEAESLRELTAKIADVMQRDGTVSSEVLFIDDGSTDESWSVIESLAAEHSNVRGIRFRRNFGKAAALAAGFKEAHGQLVFTMDADLQDDPEEIPRFLEKIDQGWDVVSGWKQVRHDPWHKTLPSRVFNWMVGTLTGVHIHDHNCGFKLYRTEVVRELRLYGEMHRFVPVLADARGWRVTEIAVQHHPRKFGYSKYGVRRLLKGFLDLATVFFLTGFGQRPLHLLGAIGMGCFAFGFLGLGYLSILWGLSRVTEAIAEVHLHRRALFYFSITGLLLGGQLLAAGLIAELLAAASSREVTPYSISETTSAPASAGQRR